MDMLNILQQYYEAYDEKATQVRLQTKGFGGIWGMGEDPKNHPCHVEFYHGVAQLVTDFLTSEPESSVVYEAAQFILGAANQRRERDSYWFAYAAQAHVVPMIEWMSPEDCKSLSQWYDTQYKKLERMPVQRDMYKKLRARGKK